MSRLTDHLDNTFDSITAQSIIPKQYRAGVNKILLAKAERLVKFADHDSFFMVTYLYNLPEKALVKYDLLCHVFKACGYEVVHTEPELGKHMWQMNRQAPVPLSPS